MRSERNPETRTGGRAATTGVIPGDFVLSVGNPRTVLPNGWHWTLLTDVARLETGHTPSRSHPEYWGGNIPWIGIRDATGNHGRTIQDTAQHTNALGIQNSSARVLPSHTVCLSRTASVGYVVVMGRPMATSQDFVNWVCSDKLDYRFLKYVLLAERDSFLRFASGTTHQTIYFPEAKAFHIALPPIHVQKAIADALSVLDERIESLGDLNTTLESIAQAIFKSWFIDFEPVRAKAEDREPEGMDAETAALFPSNFKEAKLGLIPTGWRVGSVCDVADVVYGAPFASKLFNSEARGTPLIRIRDLATFSPDIFTEEVHPKGRLVQPGELLVGMDGEFAPQIWLGEPGWLNQRVCLFSPRGRASSLWLKHALLPHLQFFERSKAGTTVIHLGKGDIDQIRLLVPPEPLLMAFADIASPILTRIVLTAAEAHGLADLRSTLLPRLISGQLRIPEAQAAIEEALT